MRKIIYIIALIGVAVFSACNLNDYPVFDDDDAFVAFESESFSFKEDADTVQIPVRLTSLSGISTTVSFELFDSTAVNGKDFNLVGGSSVLTFNAENPVQYIDINIKEHAGEFTGDLVFGIALKSSGSVNYGSIDTVYVSILDLDHPLSAILGTYNAAGTSYFSGAQVWEVRIEKDPEGDLSKVWIYNFVSGGSSSSTPLYGIVNEEKTEIKIPVGQTIAVSSSYPSILFEGYYGPDGATAIPTGGSVTCDVGEGTISVQDEFGSHVYNTDGTSAGWYNIYMADVVLTKK